MAITVLQILFLGISLLICCAAIFEDILIDGTLSPGWGTMAFIGALITAITMVKK